MTGKRWGKIFGCPQLAICYLLSFLYTDTARDMALTLRTASFTDASSGNSNSNINDNVT